MNRQAAAVSILCTFSTCTGFLSTCTSQREARWVGLLQRPFLPPSHALHSPPPPPPQFPPFFPLALSLPHSFPTPYYMYMYNLPPSHHQCFLPPSLPPSSLPLSPPPLLTCISQMLASSSRDSFVPRNSTMNLSFSQYWVWCRFPEAEWNGDYQCHNQKIRTSHIQFVNTKHNDQYFLPSSLPHLAVLWRGPCYPQATPLSSPLSEDSSPPWPLRRAPLSIEPPATGQKQSEDRHTIGEV